MYLPGCATPSISNAAWSSGTTKRRRAAASPSASRMNTAAFSSACRRTTRTLRLVPDSGAGGLVLFNAAGRASHNIVDTGETVQLATAQASRRARHVRLRELRFGHRTMRDVPAVID